MKHSTYKICFLFPIMILLLTGCWSSHEIEDLGLTFAMGFDAGRETALEKKFDKMGGSYPEKDRITVTYQYVNPYTAGAQIAGSSSQKPYINIYGTGDSFQQIGTEVALRQDRPVFSSHLKVIVIAADLLRTYSLKDLLDQSLRDNEIRLSTLVLVTRGRASDALELKDGTGKIPAFHLSRIIHNDFRAKKILPPVTLAKLPGMINAGTSYLLQNIIGVNGEIKYAGAVAINGKTNKLLGFLDEKDLDGIMWIKGQGVGGTVKNYDQKTKKLTAMAVDHLKSEIKPVVKGNRLSFKVNINSEAHLAENWNTADAEIDKKYLKRKEASASQTVKQQVEQITEKMQREYKADLAGFGDVVRIQYPSLWRKLKKNWDEVFTKIPIQYDVNITIEEFGSQSRH
ncbi:Ger(x)C family spore germination protein [Bacillus haynesii]|uniref:Ger(x)C family spore germination protein n=1 Tax=Bacillus haynesii TaxID=1925021 RepID=UPI002280BA6C|nr:Ger(x)C family spore germination protein [Bacillus haynesii]MCY7816864.1 Ger(x)C family spore germination protein [Bacillus haynesii]MCY8242159.1 Ger(x)C family spore germination protein [Bacillus haynesii]MCY8661971.1 Ger(x)C family spore germination protein [Bacillus haynesii]